MSQPDYSVPPVLTQEEGARVVLHVLEESSLDLVRLIQRGTVREENLARFFRLHYPRVQSFFRRKGFDPQRAGDLAQDVFYKVYKDIDTFRGESTFESWLMEVAESVYKNELRRQSSDAQGSAVDETPRPRLELVVPDPQTSAVVETREQLERIRSALLALPPLMRQCYLLRSLQGLKYHEISAVLGISVGAVKAHLFQARERLLGELAGQEVHTGESDSVPVGSSAEETVRAHLFRARKLLREKLASQQVHAGDSDPVQAGSSHLLEGDRDEQEDPLPEDVLTAQISNPLPDSLRSRYQELMDKRRAETLSPQEHEELIRLTDDVEKAEAARARSLLELARLKGLSVDQVIADLKIKAS